MELPGETVGPFQYLMRLKKKLEGKKTTTE